MTSLKKTTRRRPPGSITRAELIDELRLLPFAYNGRLDEVAFMDRVIPLDRLPSKDHRVPDMRADLGMHRIHFEGDWPDDWLYTDDRVELERWSRLRKFLEALLHPLVRSDPEQIAMLLGLINRHLSRDGWEIRTTGELQGRPIYKVLPRELHPPVLAQDSRLSTLGPHIATQVQRALSNYESDPALAIGVSKELVESVSKTALARSGRAIPDGPLTGLTRQVIDVLAETARELQGDAGEACRRMLGSLTGVVGHIAELRNTAGSGHGRTADTRPPSVAQARLAIDAAAAFAHFVSRVGGLHDKPVG